MSEVILQVKNLSKQYRLGEVGTGTFSHDLNRWWHKVRGKEDPYLKIGETNNTASKGAGDYVWALQNVSFEVKKGEAIGIIGKNGAGKSTLLKILSRVTSPSKGAFRAKGRISSLLEVGTGFHAEQTGRENIYLNGAILGMSKAEIRDKFDDIVDFSGVGRYIDTPVKRYSSGMYVRLAFAVAAFLEPEIMIVDEVLAVGDAEFQKKCLGKMNKDANNGRTILFVSHNMEAVKKLCSSAILLENGQLVAQGSTESIINQYLSNYALTKPKQEWIFQNAPGNNSLKLKSIILKNQTNPSSNLIHIHDSFEIAISYWNLNEQHRIGMTLRFFSEQNIFLFVTGTGVEKNWHGKKFVNGLYTSKVLIPAHMLNSGKYRVEIQMGHAQREELAKFNDLITFEIIESSEGRGANFNKAPGFFRPMLNWETNLLNNN